jgi:hypothetical protein
VNSARSRGRMPYGPVEGQLPTKPVDVWRIPGYCRGMKSNQARVPIRSSTTHPLQIAELVTQIGGRVGITFCPGKCGPSLYGHAWERDLGADLDLVMRWGAEMVLTLMEPSGLQTLKVSHLGLEVRSRRMTWVHLPIPDVSIPSAEFEVQWRQVIPELMQVLKRDGKLLVHCKGGLGRAGMVAALLLVETGETCDVAIRKVRHVRPGAIETTAQERYVFHYATKRAFK